jgi:hypothetical protein
MPYLYTCRTCALPPKTCPTRATVSAALTALGVRSAKHHCADFKALFEPGDAVTVETRAWLSKHQQEECDEEPPILKYRGRFIRYVGTKAVVFVKPGTESENGAFRYQLESETGFIKASVSRVWPSDWSPPIDVSECRFCGIIPALGQTCNRDKTWNRIPPTGCYEGAAEVAAGRVHQSGGGL